MINFNRLAIDFENSPCSLCGYEGRCLSAPPCVNCPAYPKVLNPANIAQQEKERLIREAGEAGIQLEIYQFIGLDRQHSMWYGRQVAEARKENIRLEIHALGDVRAELYLAGQDTLVADVNDKSNDGAFAEHMGMYIRDDDTLMKLLIDGEADGLTMNVTSNNWFEFQAFDENKGEWIGPDAIDNVYDESKLLDILTVKSLMSTFNYVKQYEAEREE